MCNFHVLSHLLLIYICKLHWNYYSNEPDGKSSSVDSDCFLLDTRLLVNYGAKIMNAVLSSLKRPGNPVSLRLLSVDAARAVLSLLRGKLGDGELLLIYICNFHVLSNLLLIYICKLHWNHYTMFVCQVNYF
jgi:hypothetical protein